MSHDPDVLRSRVYETYSAIASSPSAPHVFPVGRALAKDLGYPKDLFDSLPAAAVEAFAGVSNVSVFAAIDEGVKLLDLGCGAGMDSLIAARRAGRRGCVIGVDFSDAMLRRARQAAAEAQLQNLQFVRAESERLPLASGSIDVALVNGIFNLNPYRSAIFGELARVIRSGGRVYSAELLLAETLPAHVRSSAADWFA